MSVAVLRPVTTAEAVDAFLSYLKRRGRASSTVKQYRPTLEKFAQWAGDRQPAEFTAADLDLGFFTWWQERFEAKNGQAPKNSTVKNVHGILSSFYRYLANFGFLTTDGRPVLNPMLAIEAPKVRQKANDWLRADEDEALLAAPINDLETIIVWFLRFTGLRIGEALSLRWSDIDLTEKLIRVNQSKTENGIRVVPIPPELVQKIKRWGVYLQERGAYRHNGNFLSTTRTGHWLDRKTRRILSSEPGSPMKPQSVERILRRVGERVGIEGLHPHRLRRTYATYLVNAGVSLSSVSKLLGHSSTEITEKAYAELIDPQPLSHLAALAAAGAIGFIGNELAALIRLRAGKRLASPALVADGYHARTDGFVSLGVVGSAIIVALGFELGDPLIGLAITLIILRITWQSWRTIRAA